MEFRALTFLTTVILSGVLTIPVRLAAQNPGSEITIFDAPGASSAAGSGNGTLPRSINAGGAIIGNYTDANNVNHGFLRTPWPRANGCEGSMSVALWMSKCAVGEGQRRANRGRCFCDGE